MRKSLIIFLSTGAYAGCSPVVPGTVGTLWGVVIAYFTAGLTPYAQAAVIAGICVASIFVASEGVKVFNIKDPPGIVCDEICGFLVSMFLIPLTIFNAILVFLLFRFFDILKPYPVNLIDRRLEGGAGVVLDDVAAGIYANAAARVVIWLAGLWHLVK